MKRAVAGKNTLVGPHREVVAYAAPDTSMNTSVLVITGSTIAVIVLEWFIHSISTGFSTRVPTHNSGRPGFLLDACRRVDIHVSKGGAESVCKSWYGFSFIDAG